MTNGDRYSKCGWRGPLLACWAKSSRVPASKAQARAAAARIQGRRYRLVAAILRPPMSRSALHDPAFQFPHESQKAAIFAELEPICGHTGYSAIVPARSQTRLRDPSRCSGISPISQPVHCRLKCTTKDGWLGERIFKAFFGHTPPCNFLAALASLHSSSYIVRRLNVTFENVKGENNVRKCL